MESLGRVVEKRRVRNLRKRVREGIVRTHHWVGFGELYRGLCRFGTARLIRTLERIPGVQSVYLRHSHPSSPSFLLGQSDLDLTLVIRSQVLKDPYFVGRVLERIGELERFYPFLNRGDVRFVTAEELERLSRLGSSPVELLYRPEDWTLASGIEARREPADRFSGGSISWHPEFHKWWMHMVPNRVLTNRETGWEARYLRGVFRGVLKNRIHLWSASGWSRKDGPLGDDLPPRRGDWDELDERLRDLKKRRFWSSRPREMRDRLFFLMLEDLRIAALDGVFREPELVPSSKRSDGDSGTQRASRAPEALTRALCAHSGLRELVPRGIAVPEPYVENPQFRVILALPDKMGFEEFQGLLKILREDFEGGRFTIVDGVPVGFRLIPTAALDLPSLWLGHSTPFLREHVRRHHEILWGDPVGSFEGEVSREDRLTWCRGFYPYQFFNFLRRVEPGLRSGDFAHLGALLEFVETGRVHTEAVPSIECLLSRVSPSAGAKEGKKSLRELLLSPPKRLSKGDIEALFQLQVGAYSRLEVQLFGAPGARVADRMTEAPTLNS